MNFLSFLSSSAPTEPHGLKPGTAINVGKIKVKIVEKIGEGGFSTVYLATRNQEKYAIKHCKCMSAEQIELIEHEVMIMEKIGQHPNIVGFFGWSKVVSQNSDMGSMSEYYILLEYLQDSLIEFLKKRQQSNHYLPERMLFSLFLSITRGVSHIHNQNPPLAHRDMKIDNILIKYDVKPSVSSLSPSSPRSQANNKSKISMDLKLCDFGSVVNGDPKICQTASEINIETELIDRYTTLSYRAPEMIDLWQRKELSTKVDIWALGVIFFTLAFLYHPFGEGSKMQILNNSYDMPVKHPYSKKVTKLVKILLHKDPVKRPTAAQLCNHCVDIINGGKGTLSRGRKKGAQSFMVQSSYQNQPLVSHNDIQQSRSSIVGGSVAAAANPDAPANAGNGRFSGNRSQSQQMMGGQNAKLDVGVVGGVAVPRSSMVVDSGGGGGLKNRVIGKKPSMEDFDDWDPFAADNGPKKQAIQRKPLPISPEIRQPRPPILPNLAEGGIEEEEEGKAEPPPDIEDAFASADAADAALPPKPQLKSHFSDLFNQKFDEMDDPFAGADAPSDSSAASENDDIDDEIAAAAPAPAANANANAAPPKASKIVSKPPQSGLIKGPKPAHRRKSSKLKNAPIVVSPPSEEAPKVKGSFFEDAEPIGAAPEKAVVKRKKKQRSDSGQVEIEVDLRKYFATQLEILKSMGFENEDSNLAALGQSKGNVQLAIHFLVQSVSQS